MKEAAASTPPTPFAMRLLLVLLLAPLLAVGGEGRSVRIVGGTNASIEDFPYQASLQIADTHACGATLVDVVVALTAAHCVDDADVNDVTVRAGTDQLEFRGTVLTVSYLMKHPQYDFFTLDYDIAIVRLSDPWNPGPTIGAVALVSEDYYPLPDVPVVVTGWGTLQDGDADLSPQLQAVTLPVVRASACNDGYQGAVTERMLCVGEAWKGACDGDAGGPATVVENSTTQLLGIVSWNYGCDLYGYPTIVTSIASVRTWLTTSVGV